MAWIEHTLPDEPLAAEIVLHMRSVVQRRMRTRRASAREVALYYGMRPEEVRTLPDAPSLSAEEISAKLGTLRGSEVLALPHDAAHLDEVVEWLKERKREESAFAAMVATDPGTLLVLSQARELAIAEAPAGLGLAPQPIPILLEGETGTGKELLAAAVHRIWSEANGRPAAPFVAVQVGGMTQALINDELFGHVRGAYTDARETRLGRFEEANGGTLLIDEIGDLPHDAQVRMLRVLQEQTLSRLGDNKVQRVSVRLLAATWHDLEKDVSQGGFRQDLLHRVRVGTLKLPALRERRGFFAEGLDDLLAGLGQSVRPPITRAARDALALHPWPGNLRELVSVLREALANAHGGTIRLEDLPPRVQRHHLAQPLLVRAPGVLEDVGPNGASPKAVVAARVRALAELVERHPLPPESPELVPIREFLAAIPDPSRDHQASLRAVRDHIERLRRAHHRHDIAMFWQQVAAVTLDANVKPLVDAEAGKAAAHAQRLVEEANTTGAQLRLERSPWFQMVNELHALPLFSQMPVGELLKGVVAMLSVGYTLAPGVVDEVRALIEKGGVKAVRAKIRELAMQSQDTNGMVLPGGRPSDWTKADWQQVKRAFPSKSEASRALKIGVRTIDRNLEKHRLRWR